MWEPMSQKRDMGHPNSCQAMKHVLVCVNVTGQSVTGAGGVANQRTAGVLPLWWGRNVVKMVPLVPGLVLVLTRMFPP